ncbi:somatostatin receptor type 4-like [Lytechinus variegatus]|uniref:somatostatin receptor type 4-like n=1 Tax=Lytechinus variegatus TaxID=7654 RepID=UPI001BB14E4E|nr:somatostatin receptor type 4-like [Lytechinus variegatus]
MACMHATIFQCSSNDTLYDIDPHIQQFEVAVLVVSCICVLLGVVGNALIVYIVPKKDMHSVCNIFVANLAIRDIIFLATFGLAVIVDHGVFIRMGSELRVMPLISVYALTVTILATSGLLVALAIDRFQSIGHPLQSRSKKSFYKAHIATAVIWIVSFILPIVHPIMKTPNSPLSWLLVVIVNTAVAYVLPLATVGICYVFIIIAVRRGQEVSGESNHLTRWEFKRKIRVLRMVAYVVFLFSLTWGAWWGFNVYIAYLNYKGEPIGIHDSIAMDITDLMVIATSVINPFIYGLTDANFNRHLKRILCWSCAPRSLHQHGSSRNPGEIVPLDHAEYSIVKRRYSHSNGRPDKSALRMSAVDIECDV